MKKAVLQTVLLACVLAGGVPDARAAEAPRDQLLEQDEAPPGGDFTLQSADGPLGLADLRGQVVLLNFGYTACPDICPLSLGYMAQSLNALNDEELQRVQGLFITLDPGRDSAAVLKDYVRYFHERILGLTGSTAQIETTAKQYGVRYSVVHRAGDPPDEYALNHSAALYLIAPDGTLRFLFPHATPPAVVTEAIRYLLAGE